MRVIQRILSRKFSSSQVCRDYMGEPYKKLPTGPMCPKVKAKQELFQKDNDLPVHIKGGGWDVMSYRLVALANFVGLMYVFRLNYVQNWVEPFEKPEE